MNNETELVTAPAPKKEEGGFLFDALEMFVWALAVLLVLFTFAFRLCRVEGSSMENTLYEGENLILYSLAYKPQQDDIIVLAGKGHETYQTIGKTNYHLDEREEVAAHLQEMEAQKQ